MHRFVKKIVERERERGDRERDHGCTCCI